jgi:hypothetical protein
MVMTSFETLKISLALDIKLSEVSVSRDIGTEGRSRPGQFRICSPLFLPYNFSIS